MTLCHYMYSPNLFRILYVVFVCKIYKQQKQSILVGPTWMISPKNLKFPWLQYFIFYYNLHV